MRSLRVVVIIALALGLPAVAARAQDINPLSIYFGAGYGKLSMSDAPGGSLGLTAGAILNVPLTGLGLGAEVGYLMLGSKNLPNPDGTGTAKYSWRAVPVTAQGYYHLPIPGPITPWATLGFGYYDYREKIGSTTNHARRSGFNAGIGADVKPIGLGLKLGLDLRYHMIMTPGSSTNLVTALARMYL